MRGGIVNLGVGILSEASQRLSLNVPQLFGTFVEKLKRSHHRCANLRLSSPAIGGIVKTYGGAGPNHFSGGLLIGDAGSFVDPMTGEGITPAIESALIAAPVLMDALTAGKFDAKFLSAYEARFRAYFDPAMIFLDLCAATMRNRHFRESWLRAMVRGCEWAQGNPNFARITGAYFGGLEINPPGILSQIWISMVRDLATLGPRSLRALLKGHSNPLFSAVGDLIGWQIDWWNSVLDDPIWHAGWTMDLERKWLHFLSIMNNANMDPRAEGLV